MTSPTTAQQRVCMKRWRSSATELARVGQSELEQVDEVLRVKFDLATRLLS